LLRHDLFYGVGLLSVPYLPRLWGGRPTEAMRARVGEKLNFYQLYFQPEGIAEAELGQDVARTLLGFYYSASGEAPPEKRWRAIFSRSERLIDTIPAPDTIPSFLTTSDLEYYTQQFTKSGFRGPINWYRNMDRNAESLAFLKNASIAQEAIFLAGEKDSVIDMYRDAYDSLETSMPRLRQKVLLPGAGHWVQQEQPEAVSRLLLDFCAALEHRL